MNILPVTEISVFCICVSFGIISGVVFSILRLLANAIKNSVVEIVFDILYFSLLSVGFIFLSYYLKFPSFRLYMCVGVLLGVYMYVKSFHITLAIITEKVYNQIKKKSSAKTKPPKNGVKRARRKV